MPLMISCDSDIYTETQQQVLMVALVLYPILIKKPSLDQFPHIIFNLKISAAKLNKCNNKINKQQTNKNIFPSLSKNKKKKLIWKVQ